MQQMPHITRSMIWILLSAIKYAPGYKEPETPEEEKEHEDRIFAEEAAIVARVRGNKPESTMLSEAEQSLLIESTLRRGLEIVTGQPK